ncbi:signal transduction protein [Levilactobacillus fujinensis]|uniref:Signal transduction protein n=1 Tax=Levilactobacillus fujinensis TaxID=2486024 RepID=A0ABW1TGQ8_9LACO|nr:signal transduction protein [Levilactobacillus fujinensis]
MITVGRVSYTLANFSLAFWFVYFQYYWFPRLRNDRFMHQEHFFLLYCALMAGGFSLLNTLTSFETSSTLIGAIPIAFLLGIEVAIMGYYRHWEYLPAFIEVSILAYLLIEFVDMMIISVTIQFTSMTFAVSVWGTLTELVVDNIIYALLAVGIWLTRAPMENMIQDIMGRSTEYFFLGFMSVIALAYILFEYSLQTLQQSEQYLVFLAGIAGILLVGLTLSTYILMQTHLQEGHTRLQMQQHEFREQYTAELNRQMGEVRKFSHDYQNMLLGLGGYLEDKDYAGFRQLYIDIRSKWATSNAAELTIGDLNNVPSPTLKFQLYHSYLLAQQSQVQLFVQTPEPLTATVTTLKELGEIIDQALPPMWPVVGQLTPAMVTLELKEMGGQLRFSLTFPVPIDAKLDGHTRVTAQKGTLDFSELRESLPQSATMALQLKLHWGQLIVTLPTG